MRLRHIDLLGHHFGALVATELAATRPGQVRRLVLVSPPLAADAKEPVAAAADGSHLAEEWRRAVAYSGPDAPLELATATVAEQLRNGAQAAAAAAAQRSYALRPRLPPLTVPILVLRLHDDVVANRGQARDLPARARIVELPDRGASLFEAAPEIAAQALEPFLR